jgi:hypothetical protein
MQIAKVRVVLLVDLVEEKIAVQQNQGLEVLNACAHHRPPWWQGAVQAITNKIHVVRVYIPWQPAM